MWIILIKLTLSTCQYLNYYQEEDENRIPSLIFQYITSNKMQIKFKINFSSSQNGRVHNIHKESGNTFTISIQEEGEKKALQLNIN